MATTVVSQGLRNPKFPTGGNGYINYGGTVAAVGDYNPATGTGTDDTQAILDAWYLNRGAPTLSGQAQGWNWCGVYLPPGNYLFNYILVMRLPLMFMGEPSNPPTIYLKANCPYFAAGANGGANPFAVLDSGWGHAASDNTTWNDRGWVPGQPGLPNTSSTNNMFDTDVRDINFTVLGGNPSCVCVFLWAQAQSCALVNLNLTSTSLQATTLAVGDYLIPHDSGGGGGIVRRVTCTGNANAVLTGGYSQYQFRDCTFNGLFNNSQGAMLNLMACTFNSPGGLVISSGVPCLDDCVFNGTTANFSGAWGGIYHYENCTGLNPTSLTSGSVYYNGASEPGNSSNLTTPGVIKGSPYKNPRFPEAPASTINITSPPYNVSPTNLVDCAATVRTALASAPNANIYFPPGSYRFSSTVTVGPNQGLYGAGVGASYIVGDVGTTVAVTGNGVGPVNLCNIQLHGNADTLLLWDGDPESQCLDFHVAGTGSTTNPIAWIRSGGGVFENCWWASGTNTATPNGIHITSTQPLYLYSFAPEHYAGNYALWIDNAQNVYGRGLQFEASTNKVILNGGTNNQFSGALVGGSGPMFQLSASPKLSIWDCVYFNGTATGAVTENGTTYGAGVTFFAGYVNAPTTGLPTVINNPATNVTATTATLNGSVTFNGNQTITQDGFQWGTSTLYGNTVNSTTVQSGVFSSNITGLTSGTTYYFRAFATNASGTSYSGGTSFKFAPESPNGTIVTTIGPTITDAIGGSWQLTNVNQATSGVQVTLNGTVIAYTANVIELAYVWGTSGHVVWQENTSFNWYSFNTDGSLASGPTTISPLTTIINATVFIK